MDAKVKATINVAYSGTPIVITCGFATDNIIKVLSGKRVGTLFHQDAGSWISFTKVGAREMVVAARDYSKRLQAFPSEDKRKILLDIATAPEGNKSQISEENKADVEVANGFGYGESLVAHLALKPEKISALANFVCKLADMEEPIGHVLKKIEIASLAIRSGNGLLLKGGKEARRSNAILHKVTTGAIPDTVGDKLIGLFLTTKEEIPDLLKLDDVIDLVIPRGSNKLVSDIKNATKIPVLGHSDGICHVYVDKLATLDKAKKIVLDAKTDYPGACNAMVKDNPSGDFESMHRHISKGSWTFSDQDNGWQISDYTAEGMKVTE